MYKWLCGVVVEGDSVEWEILGLTLELQVFSFLSFFREH
jgi:hypothetical protein